MKVRLIKKRMQENKGVTLITTSKVNNHREWFVRWAGTATKLALGTGMRDTKENSRTRKDASNKLIIPQGCL